MARRDRSFNLLNKFMTSLLTDDNSAEIITNHKRCYPALSYGLPLYLSAEIGDHHVLFF